MIDEVNKHEKELDIAWIGKKNEIENWTTISWIVQTSWSIRIAKQFGQPVDKRNNEFCNYLNQSIKPVDCLFDHYGRLLKVVITGQPFGCVNMN